MVRNNNLKPQIDATDRAVGVQRVIGSTRIILDLCGGTGSWSRPYLDNGYDVRNITLPDYDVREYSPPDNVYGILAAPPCTMFSRARTTAILPRDFRSGMEIVIACLNIIWECRYENKLEFWCLENPMGYLRQFLGKPPFSFQPWEYGDQWTKKTDLWGYFNEPTKKPVDLNQEELVLAKTNSRKLPSLGGHDKFCKSSSWKRAITPPHFAKAFYNANK